MVNTYFHFTIVLYWLGMTKLKTYIIIMEFFHLTVVSICILLFHVDVVDAYLI